MTTEQRQMLLAFLGYLPAKDVDGIWGKQSKAACKAFQKDFGIEADGIPGQETDKALRHAVAYGMPTRDTGEETDNTPEKTGTFWDDIEFFDREEFRCQCGGKYCNGFPVEPQEELVRKLDVFRRRLGVPVSIVDSGGSGVRCPKHNANVGGVANSLHTTGNAADLHSKKSPQEMYQIAEEVLGNTGELGLYSWGIHFGIGKYSRFRG